MNMDKKERSIEKIAGGILGLIIGDTLAFPLKFVDYDTRKQFFPINNLVDPFDFNNNQENIHINNLRYKLNNWYPAGYYSFYGQQSLLVFDSIYKVGDYDIEDISQKLVKFSYPRDRISPLGIFRGYHRQFYDSVQNIANGMPLKLCGVIDAIGDSPFKVIPMALYFGNETNMVRDKCTDLTLLTNRNLQSVAASAAIGYTVAVTSSRAFFNIEEEIPRIRDFASKVENFAGNKYGDFFSDSFAYRNKVSESINELSRLINEPIEVGVDYYKNFAKSHNLGSNSSLAVTGLALLIFFKNIGSFDNAIKTSLELDIDIDIVTPLVGALSGSLLGSNKLPKHWKKHIKYRKDIYQRAEFLKSEGNKPNLKNYYVRELELSDAQYNIKEAALKEFDEKTPVSV